MPIVLQGDDEGAAVDRMAATASGRGRRAFRGPPPSVPSGRRMLRDSEPRMICRRRALAFANGGLRKQRHSCASSVTTVYRSIDLRCVVFIVKLRVMRQRADNDQDFAHLTRRQACRLHLMPSRIASGAELRRTGSTLISPPRDSQLAVSPDPCREDDLGVTDPLSIQMSQTTSRMSQKTTPPPVLVAYIDHPRTSMPHKTLSVS